MNNYHRYLNLPVELGCTVKELCERNGVHIDVSKFTEERPFGHARLFREQLPQAFLAWFNQLNLQLRVIEIFVLPPHYNLPAHSDSTVYDKPIVKINIVNGSDQATMDWYTVNNPKMVKEMITAVGTHYNATVPTNLTHAFSAPITQPSLLNVGPFHGVTNETDQERWCLSLSISHINKDDDDTTRLLWDDALDIFNPYIC